MKQNTMKTSLSTILIVAMVFSMISGVAVYRIESVYGETAPNANAAGNKINVPKNMKYGMAFKISVSGDRYANLYARYQKYLSLKESNTQEDPTEVLKDDVSMFFNGETVYMPTKITVTKQGCHPKVTKFNNQRTDLKSPDTYILPIPKKYGAGKYKLAVEYVKYTVDITDNSYSTQEVYFNMDSSTVVTKAETFYIASKVKLSNISKKGKLAKSKRTKYLNPTKKIGKLPTPKAKKGYKFVGWYSAKNGGRKITKKVKVPVKNTQTLYARYEKK